jgi:hypothetical protein
MDLDYRLSKFDKEKEKRKKAAKEKINSEMRQQKLQEERERALAELAEKKRLEQEEIQAQNEIREIEENRITGGIRILLNLQAIPVDLENDKVKLPQSVLSDLHNKGAFSCGRPVMFQIHPDESYSSCPIRTTHCGVLEFTAEEGTVEIPTKVYRNLFQLNDSIDLTSLPPPVVSMKYIALPKITSVQFQPKLNLFSQLGPIKLILEENLQQHATLTLGDVLTIWYRGQAHEIVVKDLDPKDESVCNGGTVIDTNIEVNLEYSEEYLQSVQPPPSQSSAQPFSTQHSTPPLSSTPPLVSLPPGPPLRELPPEPSLDDSFVTFKFLFPSGGKAIRRFHLSSPIDDIFCFLRHLSQDGKLVIELNKMIQISSRQSPIRLYREQDTESLQQQIQESGLVALNGRNPSEVLAVSCV